MSDFTDLDGSSLNYTVQAFLINSTWYGVPQSRSRVYIVGIKDKAECIDVHPADVMHRIEQHLKLLVLKPANPVPLSRSLFVLSHLCFASLEFQNSKQL